VLKSISGHDSKDSTSRNISVPDYIEELEKGVKGLKVGLPKEFFEFEIQEDIRNAFDSFLKRLEREGIQIVEVSLPHVKYAIPAYYIIAPSEASSNLARYDGVRYGYRAKKFSNLIDMYSRTRDEGFGAEVKRRIMLGTFALSAGYYDAYYLKAMKVKRLIYEDFKKAFEEVDLIASPTTPTTAFRLGEKTDNPIDMYLSDILTVPVNLAGLPGISIPIGMSDNLPIGGQLIGKMWDEVSLLRVSYLWEHLYKHYEMIPQT
jgi:aspartyl-tRNA(Asn)/glutamyl-tRNA(Gln) amidotransferase subunit A